MIPEHFLDAEVRDGFPVSTTMKKIWAVELDLLEKFIEVCDANNLSYYADGGTILGAIRHRGFIPWDNDIDVAMPRPDYEKLLELGNSLFESPYFLQTPVTEEGRYFGTWAKLCNSKTTGRCKEDFLKGINCGIFIDIFPFDKIPDNRLSRLLYFKRINRIRKVARFCFATKPREGLFNNLKFLLRKFDYSFILNSPDAGKLFTMFNKYASSSWNTATKFYGGVIFGYVEKYTWLFNEWAKCSKRPFEYLNINVPDAFDSILSKQYGDYMTFPDDKSTHCYYSFEPDIAYQDYWK